MLNAIQIFLIFLSALTVIVADAVIKKVSAGEKFLEILVDPWMILVYALYFIQILFAVYIFIHEGEIAIYSNLYNIFYGILGVLIGILFFKEGLSFVQMVGVVLGLAGTVLMNYK